MRKSVLTGIFACALIFASQVEKAQAVETAIEKTSQTTSFVSIETMNESLKSPLLLMTEVKEEAVVQPEVKKIIHTVAENETLSTIAKQYQTTWERIYSKNTQIANPNIVSAGIQLTIPEASEELPPRPAPITPVEPVAAKKQKPARTTAEPAVPTASKGSSGGNGYVAGYCTWYVKNRRPDMPNNLGNASTWVSRAAAQGIATGSTPRAGAIGQKGNHVVYVESVNADGTVTISEMNHKGRYVHTTRTLPASYFSYIY